MMCVLCQSEAVAPILSSDGHICAGHIYQPVTADPYERVPPPSMRVHNYFDLHGKARPEPIPMPPIPEPPKVTVTMTVTKANRMVSTLNSILDTVPKDDGVILSEIIYRINNAISQEVGISVL